MEAKLKLMQENQLEGLITDNDKTNMNQADLNDLQRVKNENKAQEEQRINDAQKQKKAKENMLKIDNSETIESMTEKYREMQKKYRQISYDVRDAERENCQAREEQLENIRNQNREMDFFKQIADVVLSLQEQEAIRENSCWDNDQDFWILPNFYFQEIDNKMDLPTLGGLRPNSNRGNNWGGGQPLPGPPPKNKLENIDNNFDRYKTDNYLDMWNDIPDVGAPQPFEEKKQFKLKADIGKNQGMGAMAIHYMEDNEDLLQSSWPKEKEPELNFGTKTLKPMTKGAKLAPIGGKQQENIFAEKPLNSGPANKGNLASLGNNNSLKALHHDHGGIGLGNMPPQKKPGKLAPIGNPGL